MTTTGGPALKFKLPGKVGLVLLYLLLLFAPPMAAQDAVATRLQIGINLLPAVIAANNGLATIDSDRKLSIYLVYRDDRHLALLHSNSLARIGVIRKRAIEIKVIEFDDLMALDPDPFSTIFIVEKLDKRLPKLIEFSQQQRALLFSPFKGDVKRGVATGFRVADKVSPMVNLESLKRSKIQLKAFFLRIAVQHE